MKKNFFTISLLLSLCLFSCSSVFASENQNPPGVDHDAKNPGVQLNTYVRDGFVKSWVRFGLTEALGKKWGDRVTDYGVPVSVYGGLGLVALSQYKKILIIPNPLYAARKRTKRTLVTIGCLGAMYLYGRNNSLEAQMHQRFDQVDNQLITMEGKIDKNHEAVEQKLKKGFEATKKGLKLVDGKVVVNGGKLSDLSNMVQVGFEKGSERQKLIAAEMKSLKKGQGKMTKELGNIKNAVYTVETKIDGSKAFMEKSFGELLTPKKD